MKKIVLSGLLLFYFFYGTHAYAQPFSSVVVKNYGGTGDDIFYAVSSTSDKGMVVAGDTMSGDGDLTKNDGDMDAFIMKFDAFGNKKWVNSIGGTKQDVFRAVKETSDGSYIAAGNTYSSDQDIPGNKGGSDFLLSKFDSNGNKIWVKTYGGTGDDTFYSEIVLNDGTILAYGVSSSSNGDLPANKGGMDAIVAKFDQNGNKLWIKNIGGSLDDKFLYANLTSDGNILAVGSSQSSNGDITLNKGNLDALMMKMDVNGNIIWQKTYGGSNADSFMSFVQTKDGGFDAVGYSNSLDGDLTQNKGGRDFLIGKFDQNGNKIWMKSYGGSGADYLYSLVLDQNENIYALGYSNSTDGIITANKGDYDAVMMQVDPLGNTEWIQNYGGSSGELMYGLLNIDNGKMVAVGTSMSSNGDITEAKGGCDGIILTFRSPPLTKTDVVMQSGNISLTNIVPSLRFSDLTIDNMVHEVKADLSNLEITDNRGTLEGWNVTVNATPFQSITDPSLTLGTNVFVLNGIQSITQSVGSSEFPSIINSGPIAIDNGIVKLVSAATNTGGGTYDVVFPPNAISVWVDTSKKLLDGSTNTFESTLTWMLNVGP